MSKNYQKEYTIKALNIFLENIFELAFGDNAIDKDYTMLDVVSQLRSISDRDCKSIDLLLENFNSISDFEDKRRIFLNDYVS